MGVVVEPLAVLPDQFILDEGSFHYYHPLAGSTGVLIHGENKPNCVTNAKYDLICSNPCLASTRAKAS